MKLRVRGQSLRMRLTRQEVAGLNGQGWWQETTAPGAPGTPSLIYRVETAAVAEPEVRLTIAGDAVVTVVLRAADVKEWAETENVGLYFETPSGTKVAVEKDFQCLDPRRDEDESDHFDNPLARSSRHGECGADD